MLERVYGEAMPRLAKYKVGAFDPPSMDASIKLSELRDKIDSSMAYLKGAK
jgi:hypothetical protein